MTSDQPQPPLIEPLVSPSDFDFASLVAEQNAANKDRHDESRTQRTSNRVKTARRSRSASDRNAPSENLKSKWWRIGYPAALGAVILVALPILVLSGLRVILDSSDGQLVKRVTDPAAPGYEAVVEKTPTAVAAIVAPDGSLDSAVVFALTSNNSSGLLLVPAATGVQTNFGLVPLSLFWTNEKIDGVAFGVGQILNLNFNEKLVLASSEWAALVAPYAPLTLSIPDSVRDASDAVLFPKGSVTLTPDRVASFLTSKGPKENELNRTIRQELFWKAWLAKIKSSTASFPVTTDSGIGRYVVAAARGQLSVSPLPVVPVPAGSPLPGGGPLFTIQESAALDAVAAIVPFPDGAPGGRPRIRVLDGTGQLSNGVNAAIVLNAAGGQVDVVGNAKSYGQATTQIIYFEGTSQATARKMRDALTVGEIVESKQSNSGADMTVILGEDFLAKFGPTSGDVPSSSNSTTSAAR